MSCVQLYFLIYVSLARDDFAPDELLEILRVSRENNTQADITGLLLYKQRRFMQLLEGPEVAVRATFARIERDPRHHDVTILLEGETSERDFADWSMAFHELDDKKARATRGFSDFLDVEFSVFQFASDPSKAHQLLRIFRRI
ncbi:MAG: BLUF domain-containing protein [Verrucomicrobiota bacterium]|nr:BLUF domain-containing protein [Verrucomicrobiota bacterium]